MAPDTTANRESLIGNLIGSFVAFFVTGTLVAVTVLSLFDSLDVTSGLVGTAIAFVTSAALIAYMLHTYRRRRRH